MEILVEIMKKVLAESFAIYLKASGYHWNVSGTNFPMSHSFLGDLYEQFYEPIDSTAEHIRTLEAYVPASFSRYLELSEIQDETSVVSFPEMCSRLYSDNEKLLNTLNTAFKLATQFDKQGLANYLADRIDKHQKIAWQLRMINTVA